MNCNGITWILDDGDTGRLDERTRLAAGAHLDTCAECARQWDMHARLVARARLLAQASPPAPQELAEACRPLVQAGQTAGGAARARNRFILIGTIAVLAAAASMLLMSLRNPAPEVAAAAPVAAEEVAAVAPAGALAEEVAPMETAADPDPPFIAANAEGYSVLILPIEAQTQDPAIIAAVRQFQQKVVEVLRTLPGVMVVESSGPDREMPDYALLFIAQDPMAGDRRGAGRYQMNAYVPRSTRTKEQLASFDAAVSSTPELLQAQGMKPDSIAGYVQAYGYNSIVSTSAGCRGGFCPSEAANSVVASLRTDVFIHDLAIQRELLAKVFDPGLDSGRRQSAIFELNSLVRTGRAPKVDAELVRNLVDLHAGTTDAQRRTSLWNSLAVWKDPALVAPIVELTRTEADELVRATLVTRLAGNFGDDPAARKALQDISSADASQLVRQVARRALLGEADWHQYVLDTVRDRELSARQRFEPIRYLLSQTAVVTDGKALVWRTLDEFDADTIGALAETLPAAWSDSGPLTPSTLTYQLQLGSVFNRLKHPALADLLLKSVEDGKPIQKASLPTYLEKYIDDPRVFEALQKLGDDTDAPVRNAARKVLAKYESSAGSATQ